MESRNSKSKFSIISKSNSEKESKDNAAYVELDKFACYVFTEGLQDQRDVLSAGLIIETILRAFRENPSIKENTVLSYLEEAIHTLVEAEGAHHLKASIFVVVSDYVKLRYAYVGNTELKMYRNGVVTDMDRLSGDIRLEQEQQSSLNTDEERGNEFAVFVSKAMEPERGDILTFCTQSAGNGIETEIENKIFAMVITDWTCVEPDKKQRVARRSVTLAMIAAVVSVLGISLLLMYLGRVNTIEEFNQNYKDTIEYIQDNNYIRAEKECQEALKLAKKLKDKKKISEAGDCLKLIEAVNAADEYYKSEKYREAKSGYLTAKKRSRCADNVSDKYINKQLSKITDYYIILYYLKQGDDQKAQGEYAKAEEYFLLAKDLATDTYFQAVRWEAINALEQMYLEEIYMADTYMDEYTNDNVIERGYVIINDEKLKLEERTLMDGRISMLLPEDFQPVDALEQWDDLSEPIPSEWMYSNRESEASLTLMLERDYVYTEEDIRALPDILAEHIEADKLSAYAVEETGTIGEGTETIGWMSMATSPEDDSFYWLIFFRLLPEGVLMGSFDCEAYEKEEWESIIYQLLGTVQELETESYMEPENWYL